MEKIQAGAFALVIVTITLKVLLMILIPLLPWLVGVALVLFGLGVIFKRTYR